MRIASRISFATLALAVAANAWCAQPSIMATPTIPAYGQAFQVQLANNPWPYLLTTVRYWVSGSVINVDYEYTAQAFSPMPINIGDVPISFGEMAPGNYTVNARLYNLDDPSLAPQTLTTSIPVLPPSDWGVYSVPGAPGAFEPWRALVRSAVYYDPATLRASVSGGVIRVDFDYYADAPLASPAPAGATSYASVPVSGLAPGTYALEGWGRPKTGGDSVRYFVRTLSIGATSPVIEFYNEGLDHYFMSAGPGEVAAVDGDAAHAWKRTGQRWNAYLRASDAPPNANPVCRFYGIGPQSHFYTGNPDECAYLKSLEQAQRAAAASVNQPFTGWQYEGIAFYAIVPDKATGQCPGGTSPVYRAYNRNAGTGSNHRFTTDSWLDAAMLLTWGDEGVAFCSPH